MKLKSLFVGLAAGSVLAAPLQAAETVSYTYDALGRLTTTTTSGGPASGIATGTGYDPAGNRTTYTVTGASAALQMTPFAGDRQLARLGAGPARGAGPKGPERVPHGGL